MKIRTLILSASALVSVLFFGTSYFLIDRIFERAIKDNAAETSGVLADLSFNAMYEVMSTGWKRDQVESFLAATQRAMGNSSDRIQIYRGPVVAALYGEIKQPDLDEALRRVFAQGERFHADLGDTTRTIFPLKAEAK